jgi:hypothetical protein
MVTPDPHKEQQATLQRLRAGGDPINMANADRLPALYHDHEMFGVAVQVAPR